MKNTFKQPNRSIIVPILILLATTAILLSWLHLHPGDLYARCMAVGSSVCHQLPTHSFIREDVQFPICARCSGLYLGCFIGILYYAFQHRKSGLPKKGYLFLFLFLTAAWAGDGLNSFINDFAGRPYFYATTNITRVVTGFGMGLVLSTALMTLFNLSIWKNPQKAPLLHSPWQVAGYAAAAAALGSLLAFGGLIIFKTLAYISVLTIITVISALYTIFWVIIFHKENTFERLAGLYLFMLAGLGTAMVQMTLLSALRAWVIG